MRFLLLHSPLITKETWIALVIALEGAGFEATVISFDNVASEGESYHRHHISQAQPFISKVGDEKVIAVAHSGSGNILALFDPDSVDAYVFLDAMFPIVEASRFDLFDDPASIEGWRKVARENNGMLPRSMLARFGSQITDDGLRSTFIGALSDVPIALYEEKTPVHPE